MADKKLKIAVITMEFVTETYFSGGIANQFFRIFKSLNSMGNEIHIFTLSSLDNSSFEYKGLNIHRIQGVESNSSKWLNRLTRYKLHDFFSWIDFSFRAFLRFRKIHQSKNFDILQFPNSYGCGIFSMLFSDIKTVVQISGYRPLWNRMLGAEPSLNLKLIEKLEWATCKLGKNIYCPSKLLKDIIEKNDDISNIRVIRTPIYIETEEDSTLFESTLMEKQYILFYGRLQLHKGFHILAQALPDLLNNIPEMNVVFAGLDCPTRLAPSMKQYALDLNSRHKDRMIFLGQVNHDQLYPVIRNARLVVLPSLIDNLPNTCLESMVLGKPVIGTIGASFDELIENGKNGFLVPIGDVSALSEKIIEAWHHPELEKIGYAAKKTVSELHPDKMAVELLQYYRSIIN